VKHNTIDIAGTTFAVLPLSELEALERQADAAAARAGLAEMAARPQDLLTSDEALRLADMVPAKFWRERRGMKAVELANAAGISPAYLSEIETGKKSGTMAVMARIADTLHVTLDDLKG